MLNDLLTRTEHLSTLDPAVKPQWGSMNPHQMIEHLSLVVRVSNGKLRTPQLTPLDKLEKARAFLFSDQPLPQNFKAPFIDDTRPLRTPDIAGAIAELKAELADFEKHFEEKGRKETHPIFGELDHEQWRHFHRKHFTHHMTQFGLL